MKKQALIITSLAIVILLSETDLSSDLLLFFLVGAIPGTHYSLSSGTMLALIIVTALTLLYWQPFVRTLVATSIKHVVKYVSEIKERLSKHPLIQN